MVDNFEEIREKVVVPDNPYDAKITNIVFGVDLGGQVFLDKIASELDNAEYEPESFPGLVYRIPELRATALVFTSGMSILSGINSIEDAAKAADRMIEDFKSIGLKYERKPKMKIVNLVVSATLKSMVDLNKIIRELGDCEYEPEQFPGLIYRMEETGTVILIFSSGRLIVTGSKDVRVSLKSIEILDKKLREIGALIKKR